MSRRVQAGQRAGKLRLRPVRRIERGMSANTPMANSTGDANAPRNRNRGSSPMTRYAATIAQAMNVVAS